MPSKKENNYRNEQSLQIQKYKCKPVYLSKILQNIFIYVLGNSFKKNCTSNDNVSTIQLYSTKAVTVICECFFKKFLLSPIQYVF